VDAARSRAGASAAGTAPAAKDVLDQLAEGPLEKLVMLMFWRERFRNPEMSLQITEQDLKGFEDCMTYLDVKPQLAAYRPQGRPAQEAVPARPGHRGVAARPAEPPRPFVFLGVVDGKGYQLKPIENNEDDAARRDEANAVRRAREKAPQLASLLLGMCQQGTFSNAEIQDAARTLTVLANAAT
jgi:hypothetical protein